MIKSYKTLLKITAILSIAMPFSVQAQPNQQGFDQWISNYKSKIVSQNIASQDIVDRAFNGAKFNERVIELDKKQPEFTITFDTYKKRIVNPRRIAKGQNLYRKYHNKIREVSQGIPPEYVIALWGIETNFGTNTGSFNLVESLANLAYEGRRSEFFEKELTNAMKILQAGHIAPEKMKGSWAGAMGQNQFMPSSFLNFAKDGNGDGKADIWNDRHDVFASTSNYLIKNGWKTDQTWGRPVQLPRGFNKSVAKKKTYKTLDQWARLGVKRVNGEPLPRVKGMKARIVLPDGNKGPAFITYKNFDTILRWNRSDYFATSVGLLADAIRRAGTTH